MKLTIDTSVALKLVVLEPGSDRALSLARSEAALIAPDLIHAEMASALWANVSSKRLARDVARSLSGQWQPLFNEFHPLASLSQEALRLAFEIGHAVYDCFFLATAIREDAPLITADKRFLAALKGTEYEARARSL